MEREPVDTQDKPLNDIILYDVKVHANPIADLEKIWENNIYKKGDIVYWCIIL